LVAGGVVNRRSASCSCGVCRRAGQRTQTDLVDEQVELRMVQAAHHVARCPAEGFGCEAL
jgi:hypothetical protein